MNAPRSGSTANAWTLVRMPERTRNVPTMLIEKATTPSRMVQVLSASRAASTSNGRSKVLSRPSTKAAFTCRMSSAMVLTLPITAIAMSWVTSHLRSTTATRSITCAACRRRRAGSSASAPRR